ncbi:hypothetical protein BIFPSEUDO_04458 [Bifidobacterium pseudocatenulatum DSM 20438 = JCM 1200 = LMG 10505]|uniref:Uncharacterized protein n=1 Tax=Bifidobacterium pseudocatenulatum DSM 20438 = JCM 1200 = LMG 10505 TaxID=547043 RepID=C0BVL0_BIFPS|nr:hypothetical protein BIFPSEUDO_04458 [Bifidobacterium pseudocatenulatum DSM 20438 = JCM 1200 = LMG 10505]
MKCQVNLGKDDCDFNGNVYVIIFLAILWSQEILSDRKKHARRRQQMKLVIPSKVTVQGNRNM